MAEAAGVYALRSRFKSRARLEAENLVLRQQINILICKIPKRVQLTNSDRLLLVCLYQLFPSILSAIKLTNSDGRLLSTDRATGA